MTEPLFKVRIVEIRYEAEGILSFVLRSLDGADLPAAEPGAHVDVHLSNEMMRSYSLSNDPVEDRSYRLTVARDPNSKGGSVFMHEQLHCGEIIEISYPRNNFELTEDAQLSVFFAGGIGITPFVPMIKRLNRLGRRWRLHYSARSPKRAALLGELQQLATCAGGDFLPNYDEVPGGKMLDLKSLMSTLPRDAHLYCCGPIGMLDAFRAGAQDLSIPSGQVHFEYFSSSAEKATDGGFVVFLAKSGKEVAVRTGQSILHAVNDAGAKVPFSCEEGVCGACETRVIEGLPDHRDMILSDKEREENKTMMICCSGSRTPRLVLDL